MWNSVWGGCCCVGLMGWISEVIKESMWHGRASSGIYIVSYL